MFGVAIMIFIVQRQGCRGVSGPPGVLEVFCFWYSLLKLLLPVERRFRPLPEVVLFLIDTRLLCMSNIFRLRALRGE